jgi:cis-L-3-hydroxyproline dehydratase
VALKITAICVYGLELPLAKPFLMSRGRILSFDIPILAMCMAGTVLNDTVVAHFAQSIPGNRCLGAWSCQEMLTVDLAPGQGARNVAGNFAPPQLPGLGVEPDRTLLGAPLMEFN